MMLPVLFSFGPITLRTVPLFVIVAWLLMAFVFWRKGREEHYSETELFDVWLQASLVGFLAGRVGHIVSNFELFNFSVIRWLDFFTYPGLQGLVAWLAATWALYRAAKKKKWDVFEILDFWSQATALGVAIICLGLFFDGTFYGVPTTWPVGVTFPGLFDRHHPTQLYFAGFFLALFWYLQHVELRYRTFRWYRAGKKTAQTGFLIASLIIASGVFSLVMTLLKPPSVLLQSLMVERVVSAAVAVLGLVLLYVRSGRTVSFRRKKRPLEV